MAEKHEQAYIDYQNGMKYKDIAVKYDVSIDAVKKWKSRFGWVRNGVHKNCTQNKKRVHEPSTPSIDANTQNELLSSVEQNAQLTDKQRLFCLCYIKNFNATQAAINAGYSPDTARFIGYENLTKPHIRDEIQRLKTIKAQSILLTQDDVVERYMRIAFADMGDYVSWGREEQVVINLYGPVTVKDPDTGKEQPLTREVNTVRLKESNAVDTSLIHRIKQVKDGVSIELISSEKAMAWLDKYFLLNPLDRHKLDYDNARLSIEKQKADSGMDTGKPIEITIKRATKEGRKTPEKADNITKNTDK